MRTPLKKVCIFSLASGIGLMLIPQVEKMDLPKIEKELTIWNAKQIASAGQAALKNCRVKVDKSRVRQVKRKIDEIKKDKDEFDITETLSFLFLGILDLASDLSRYKKTNTDIEAVSNATLNFITMYDSNLENSILHETAGAKYREWIEGEI